MHFDVAISLSNLGTVLEDEHDYDGALLSLRRAASIAEETLGAEHPYYGGFLANIAEVLVLRNEASLALPLLEQAHRICQASGCSKEFLAQIRFYLARALVLTGGDARRARSLAREAYELYGAIPSLESKRKDVKAWLARQK